jgi:DNA-binding SARP family transcriptional activator
VAAARARLQTIEPKDRDQWVHLAAGYRHAYCPTLAEQAAAHAEAETNLEEALEIEPANDDGWARLIEAYQRMGNPTAAAGAVKRRAEHRAP